MEDNKAAPSAPPKGAALRAAPLGVLVLFHLVRISYVSASLPEPILARFSSKFAGSVNFPMGLPKRFKILDLLVDGVPPQ